MEGHGGGGGRGKGPPKKKKEEEEEDEREAAGEGSPGPQPPTGPNPFVHDLRLSPLQRAKFYVLGIILAPIRVALAFVVLFLIWPFALLQVVGLPEETLQEPFSGWRNTVSHGSVYLLSRLMFFLLGFMRIRVRGQMASRLEAPILVAAPHSTFFDPIILLPCDLPKVVSRTENLHVPVIGALLRFNQAILVSRHEPASRKKVVEEVKKRATSRGKWPQVLFFPEGTCSNKKALLKFKPGAFISGVPIQPILIRYPNSLDSTTWAWRGPGVLKVIWLTASQPCTTVEVEFLPVYHPSAEEAVNPTLYANNVQKVMAKALGIPATDCEFVGNLPVTVVGRLRVALEPRIWELGKVLRKTRSLTGGTKCQLDPLPAGTSGKLKPAELAQWLSLTCPEAVEGLCTYFQKDSEGNMDSREVVLALEALEGEHDPQELTRHAFELFSENAGTGDCRLLQDGFCTILRLLLGTPAADGAALYSQLCAEECSQDGLILDEFQDFSLRHPDYARLFSTYLRPPAACTLPKPGLPPTCANGSPAALLKNKAD
ncbi:lysophospholipid acyltransferase LPCAT4 [Sceloporus undulatus]|uniref:lysophospholipid acyltransferase LPCAT4 n=1 Tax=Sceloporus undulatus TaxID=8520 RepID=UPI001C4C403A|nr:lysophospholipid acyltransferase LPCAT4 [Sceloporus undulatus]